MPRRHSGHIRDQLHVHLNLRRGYPEKHLLDSNWRGQLKRERLGIRSYREKQRQAASVDVSNLTVGLVR